MKQLKINIPAGYVIDKLDMVTGDVTFKQSKDVMERINSLDDVLRENNMSRSDYNELIKNMSSDTVAYETLKLIVKAYNEGKEVDFGNSNQYKYYPRFYFDASSGWSFDFIACWCSYSTCGARLCFLERKHAEDAITKFLDVYKDFL